MIVVRWSFTPPNRTVSLYEHCKALPLMMLKAYAEAGGEGIYATSCEVVAILDTLHCYKRVEHLLPGSPMRTGALRGVQVWVNFDIVENEVLVVGTPDDLYPKAKLVIDDLVSTTVLDRLAKL